MYKMNRMNFKFILKSTIILFLIGLISIFIYLNFAWLSICSTTEMKHNAEIINQTETLPDNFIKLYDSLYPRTRHYSMADQLINQLKHEFLLERHKNINCKCDDIGYTAWNNDDFKFKGNLEKLMQMYPEFGFGLEKYSSPEKCFDFWYQHDILYRGKYLKNLNKLSELTLKKSLDSLNRDEMIKLIIYRRQPNRFFTIGEIESFVKTQKEILNSKK